MPKKCCVPRCVYKDGDKRSLFLFPKKEDLKKKWIKNIPTFTENLNLEYAFVCIKHFEPRYIKRFNALGSERLYLKKPKLVKGAIPTIFPNFPSYVSKKVPKQRSDPEKRKSDALILQNKLDTIKAKKLMEADTIKDFSYFKSNYKKKLNLMGWDIKVTESYISFYQLDLEVNKNLKIRINININVDLIVKVFSNNIEQNLTQMHCIVGNDFKINSWSQIQRLMNLFFEKHEIKQNSEYSINTLLGFAFKHLKNLSQFIKENEIEYEYKNLLYVVLDQVALMTQRAKKYTNNTMLFAHMIFLQSPNCYETIRDKNMLILPHKSTLHRIASYHNVEASSNSATSRKNCKDFPQLLEGFENQLAVYKEQVATKGLGRLKQQQKINNINIAAISTPVQNSKKVTQNSKERLIPTAIPSFKSKTEDVKQLSSSSDVSSDRSGSALNVKRNLDNSYINSIDNEDAILVHTVKRLKNGKLAITTTNEKIEDKLLPQISRIVNGGVRFPPRMDNSDLVVIIKEPNSGIVSKVIPSANSFSSQRGETSVRNISQSENAASRIVGLPVGTSNLTTVGVTSTTNTLCAGNPIQQRIIQKIKSVSNLNQTARTSSLQITSVVQKDEKQTIRPAQRPQIVGLTTVVPPSRQVHDQIKTNTIFTSSPSPENTVSNAPQYKLINGSTRQIAINKTVNKEEENILKHLKSADLQVIKKTIPSSQDTHLKASSYQSRMDKSKCGPLLQHQQLGQIIKPKLSLHSFPTKLSIAAKRSFTSLPGVLKLYPVVTEKILTECDKKVPLPTQTTEKKNDLEIISTQLQLINEEEEISVEETMITSEGQQILNNEDDTQLLVSDEDESIDQIASKNADGLAQSIDDGQEFTYVTAEDNHEESSTTGELLLDNVTESVNNILSEQQNEKLLNSMAGDVNEIQYVVKQDGGTVREKNASKCAESKADANATLTAVANGCRLTIDTNQKLTIQTRGCDNESEDTNIPAEIVQADAPSPGGTRRVILLLQDGTLMMSKMHDDIYQSLNIA